jgi:hypothetical protein
MFSHAYKRAELSSNSMKIHMKLLKIAKRIFLQVTQVLVMIVLLERDGGLITFKVTTKS